MATSGVHTLTITAADLVNGALRIIGAKEAGEAVEAESLADGLEALNILLKSYENQGIHRWRFKEGVLFTENDKARYLIGPTGDRTTEETDFVNTTLNGAHSSGATVLTLDSVSGIAVNDNIGIRISATERHWTTVDSIADPTVTINTGLSGDAQDDSTVFVYTNKVQRPLRITHGRRQPKVGVGEIPTFDVSRGYFFDLTTRGLAKGLPVEHHYEPLLDNGELQLWPTPNNVDFLWRFTYTEPFEIVVSNSDTMDFPIEWIRALKWNLAAELIDEFRNSLEERAYVQSKASGFLQAALNFDREKAPLRIVPDFRQRH